MLGKLDKNPQLDLGAVPLIHFLDEGHELFQLARKVEWQEIEKEFHAYYSAKGAPSTPIRMMIGLILLKKAFRYSDKASLEQWLQNPYWQHFCGEVYFRHKAPFHHGDYSHFRKRVGRQGEMIINRLGSQLFGHGRASAFHERGRKDKHRAYTGMISATLNRLGHFLVNSTTR